MLLRRLLKTTLLTSAALGFSLVTAQITTSVVKLLPSSGQVAQIMRLGSVIAIVDLQKRIVAAGGSRDALQSVMDSAAKGQAPSYDSRLGITREEFGKYLAFQPVLESTGKTMRLSVIRDSSHLIFGDTPSNGILRGISLDLKTGELKVPEGFTFKADVITPSAAPDRSIDIRGGFQWNLRGFNADSQSGIKGQLSLYVLGENSALLAYKRTSSLMHGVFGESDSELLIKYNKN